MSEMVERVAVWFCLQRGLDPGRPVWTGPIEGPRVAVPTWTRFAEEARALIAEMREPTAPMLAAGASWLSDERGNPGSEAMAHGFFQSMIDEALKD